MPSQRALSRALYPRNYLERAPRAPHGSLFGRTTPLNRQSRAPRCRDGMSSSPSVVDREPFKPLPWSYAARVRPQIRPPRVQRGSLKAGEQHQLI